MGLNSIRSWVKGQWSKLPSKTMETETCRRDWNLEYVTISEKSQNWQERTSSEFQMGREGQDKLRPTFKQEPDSTGRVSDQAVLDQLRISELNLKVWPVGRVGEGSKRKTAPNSQCLLLSFPPAR